MHKPWDLQGRTEAKQVHPGHNRSAWSHFVAFLPVIPVIVIAAVPILAH